MSASRFRGIADSCGEDAEKWEEGGESDVHLVLYTCVNILWKDSVELWTAAVCSRGCLFTVR